MAGSKPSISRRRVLGVAAALPIAALTSPVIARSGATKQSSLGFDPDLDCFATLAMTWKQRLARYRRIAATATEAAETGWFHEANARYDRELEAIDARFGARGTGEQPAEAKTIRAAAFRRVAAAEDAYWERCTAPMQEAAVALALTPAPDVAAVREKIGAMRAVQLHELDRMKRDCFEVLEEDLGRLGG